MHILPNISTSKGNQTVKFGQLIEYNLRNIFAEKSYTKYTAESIPRPLSKISKWSISLDQQCNVFSVCFYCMLIWGLLKYSDVKLQTTCFYLIQSFFKKQKVDWNQLPCFIFCIIFKEKYFSWDILLADHISLSGCL